ncbi:TonB-dependent receptor plug domain-containing protein [Chryseobacterium indologenes]|uniref:TonB-dependent receptor n=1 Tax=Chryseobacterium indologenes TaxID=253 RepID=UPI0023E77B35|nr:TonB-dependent receptor plug domain-containing protein [Chryseobacterium indologenes]WET50622.1 TonB-dependent receptor plug domain-containing protein [Chryseobacterium indologenes]
MKKSYILVLFLAAITFTHAQENENRIDEVEIHARSKVIKEREEFKKHAQSTEIISEYEINRNNPAFIEQSLNTMAGVQVEKRTQLGGQRIVVRGYGNDQKFNNWGIKMYLNNIPLTGADGVTVLDDVNFGLINRIEVIKGPAATLYGGGSGGAVRLYIQPENKKGNSVSEQFMTGSFGLFQSSTSATSVGDHYSITANYGHIGSDGYRPHGKSIKNFYNINGEFKLNSNQKITLLASHGNSLEHVSGQISYNDYYNGIDNGNFAYIRRGAKTKFVTSRIGIGHSWKITPNFKNNTTIFYTGTTGERIAAGANETSSFSNYGLRSVFEFNKDWEHFKSQTELGVEIQQSQSTITNYRYKSVKITEEPVLRPLYDGSYFNTSNNQNNYFAVEKITYKPWNLMFLAGISINQLSYKRKDLLAIPGLFVVNGKDLYNKDLSFDKKFKAVASPHFALQKTWNNQILNISYSEGYNAPTSVTAFITGLNVTNDHLVAEKAKMWDFSVQGLIDDTSIDYQFSLFSINIKDKLTQLGGRMPNAEQTPYTYWANTGEQNNKGLEMSVGYSYKPKNIFISRIQPFINYTYNDFKYSTYFKENGDKANVVGVPKTKVSVGLDFDTKIGFYWQNTYNYMGSVYTDFTNNNKVKSFGLLNSKIGYRHSFNQWDLDVFLAGNNLTSQINYTFLFYGNSINDSDKDNQYNNTAIYTDVNPGSSKAYFFTGFNLKYNF